MVPIKTQQFFLLLSMTVLVAGYQNCSGEFQSPKMAAPEKGAAFPNEASVTLSSDPALTTQATAILQTKCASCHQNANMGNVTQILNMSHLVASGLITPGDPTQGRLVGSMTGGTMPPAPQNVTAGELTTIKNWISSIKITGSGPLPTVPSVLPNGMTVSSDANLRNTAQRVLLNNCAGCHQSDAKGGISNIMDVDHIVRTGLVVPGDASQGRLIGSVQDGSMPESGSRLSLSSADRQALTQWINSMRIVPVNPAVPNVPFVPVLAPTYQSVSLNILIPKCTGCHGAKRSDGDYRYDTYAATLRSVRAGSASNSKLYAECKKGSMPERPFASLSADEIATIKLWIDMGASNN